VARLKIKESTLRPSYASFRDRFGAWWLGGGLAARPLRFALGRENAVDQIPSTYSFRRATSNHKAGDKVKRVQRGIETQTSSAGFDPIATGSDAM
jgi:hypothetical protein